MTPGRPLCENDVASLGRRAGRIWALELLALVGAAVLGWFGTGATPASAQESPLSYTIRTEFASGSEVCGGERLTPATIGVPQLVNLGGSFLPEAIVLVVAVPGSEVGSGDVLQLSVVALRHFRGLVEAVIAPSASSSARLAVGYDACEGGAPTDFAATAVKTTNQLIVQATTVTSHPSLTLLGGSFEADGTSRVNPTSLSARMAPVPATLWAGVTTVSDTSYRASLRPNRSTDLDLTFEAVDGAKRTTATAAVDQLPGGLDLEFNDQKISYEASHPMDRLAVAVELVRPAPARTVRLAADLTGVPRSASIERLSPTHVLFASPDSIDEATVRFASFEPTVTPPALTPLDEQYLVADVGPRHATAEARLFGLSRADIDAGDPVVIDVNHTAGPLHVTAAITTESDDPAPVTATRELAVHVNELPAKAKVTYSPTEQEFSYEGSAPIDELTADVRSDVPIVDDATASHLRIVDLPTGLTGRLDGEAKTFTATLSGGAIGALELELTSGPDLRDRLPEKQQGVLVEDTNDSYAAFARLTGVREADVGWGATQHVRVVHEAGPFTLGIDVDDTFADSVNDSDVSVDGHIVDLPAEASVTYTPADEQSGRSAAVLLYDGSDVIETLTLDVVDDPGSEDAKEVHVVAGDVPLHLSLLVDRSKEMLEALATQGRLGSLKLELCSTDACEPIGTDPAPPPPDGLVLVDHLNVDSQSGEESVEYRAFVRLTDLRLVTASWGDVTSVKFDKAAGPFDISVDKDTIKTFERPEGGWQPGDEPTPPCAGSDAPWWCDPDDPDFPEPEMDVRYGFPAQLAVTIRDLPATGSFSYNRLTHRVAYRGDAVIDSVVADYQSTLYFPPRARFAHLDIAGLPTVLDLTFAVDPDGKRVTVDTDEGVLGHLDFWLASSREIVPDLTHDGLALRDDCPSHRTCERVDDFAVRGRVTRLVHLDYTETSGADPTRSFDLRRAPDSSGRGETIGLEISKQDLSKDGDLERLSVVYTDPPPSFGVDTTKYDDGALEVVYRGPGGGSLAAHTNAGTNRSGLTASIAPVPASTPTQPGLDLCFSASTASCSPETRGGHDQFSFAIEVTEPVTLNLQDCVEVNDFVLCDDTADVPVDYRNRRLLVEDLHIARSLTVMKEMQDVSWDVDNAVLYVDTSGQPVDGHIRSTRRFYAIGGGGGFPGDHGMRVQTKLRLDLPRGILADRRFGSIDCTPPSGCQWGNLQPSSGGVLGGSMTCPAGTLAEISVAGLYNANFEDEICPAPKIHSVELASGGPAHVAIGQTATIRLRGEHFSPSACTGTWPPCAGPAVQLRVPGTASPDPGIDVSGVTWHSLTEVTFDVTVSCAAGLGARDVYLANPIEGHNDTTIEAAVTVLDAACP